MTSEGSGRSKEVVDVKLLAYVVSKEGNAVFENTSKSNRSGGVQIFLYSALITQTKLSPLFYASCIILQNSQKLLAHFKAIFFDFMQHFHNLLIFLDSLHNPGKFGSSFALFEIIKKWSHNYQYYVLHKTAGTDQVEWRLHRHRHGSSPEPALSNIWICRSCMRWKPRPVWASTVSIESSLLSVQLQYRPTWRVGLCFFFF